MPLGAVVVLTDGGDNTGGVDRETLAQVRQLHLPIHTVGFGPEHFAKDVEIVDADVACACAGEFAGERER